MGTLVLQAILIIFIYANAWFLLSVLLKRNDIADIAWGLGYVLLCIFLFFTQQNSPVALLLYGLVTLWGLRLAMHIGLRTLGKAEDFRYRQWREDWGQWVHLRAYFQVYLLQGAILLIIISPLFWASQDGDAELSWLSLPGTLIWAVGFFFQAVGDWQLKQFQKRKKKGEIMQTGLWKYSRHPNYFGEICMWWGIFLLALPVEYGIWGIISPLMITFLLLYVSGIPMLEYKYKGNPAFEEYKKRTSALLPLPPRNL
jgi:steroid 5-alpha reductase family enzyme